MSALRLAALGMLALAGCTASAEMQASQQAEADRDLADALKGRVPGKPQDCISQNGVTQGPQIIDGNTILYRESGKVIWRNELRANCPSLRPYNTLIVEMHGSQLCRNDHFRVLEPGSSIPSGVCLLGSFTPYRKP